MSAQDNGGPAFPIETTCIPWAEGVSLRDWFAGQALAGLLASSTFSNCGAGFPEFISIQAGNIADAMLAERAKGGAK